MDGWEREHRTISADGVEIMTVIDGDGPPLVMLPSYGRDGLDDFDRFAEHLAASGWRVLRPQPRGIAGSSGPMQGLNLLALAEDVAQVVNLLAGGPAVVLGHAFGNIVARVLSVEHPDLVRGVILAAASATKVDPKVFKMPFIAADSSLPEQTRLEALRFAFFAPSHDPRAWLSGWYPATLAMQQAAVAATDVQPYWFGGTAPLLEIIPEHDPFKPRATWHELHDHVGDRVTTVVIDDAGHALFPEQPAYVAEAVREWIGTL